MPIYEFICKDCGERFEVIRSVADFESGNIACPKCKSTNAERRWSRVFAMTSKKS